MNNRKQQILRNFVLSQKISEKELTQKVEL